MIQGSAADQTKQAIVSCYEAGYLPILQIHDELCFNVKNGDELKIKEIMETCMEFKVPSVVDISIGDEEETFNFTLHRKPYTLEIIDDMEETHFECLECITTSG